MTSISEQDFKTHAREAVVARSERTFSLDETYWGYILRNQGPRSSGLIIAQAVSFFVGMAFAAATVGIWLFGTSALNDSLIPFRLAASVLTSGIAAMLLWYASRGEKVEVQIDTSLGEIREVMKSRRGRVTLIGRYAFDSVGAVRLENAGRRDNRMDLVIRFGDSNRIAPIVSGDPSTLEPIRERISRDLMIGSLKAARFEAVDPFDALLLKRAS